MCKTVKGRLDGMDIDTTTSMNCHAALNMQKLLNVPTQSHISNFL